jgi:hypothetical protein
LAILQRNNRAAPAPQLVEEPVGFELALADRVDAETVRVAEPPIEARTVRDYLRDYYGDRWEDVRASVEASMGNRLDTPFDENALLPFDEVAEQIRNEFLPSAERIAVHAEEALEWDAKMVEDWDSIRRAFPNAPENMRDVELQEFRAIAAEANAHIRECSQQRVAVLAELAANKWAQGDFVKAPYCLPESGNSRTGARIAVAQLLSASKTGWVVQMPVYGDELPAEYDALGKAIAKGVVDRTRQLAKYLDGKK